MTTDLFIIAFVLKLSEEASNAIIESSLCSLIVLKDFSKLYVMMGFK